MCGVPYHSADTYIGKLVERGYRVVICEQTEDPATTKGLVKRDVVRIITPGTVTDTDQLPEGKNNYLASVCISGKDAALCFADVSTGELRATVIKDYKTSIISELSVCMPRELIANTPLDQGSELYGILKNKMNVFFSPTDA
jgi:DNA mismatch repair protein MutS